MLWQFNRYKYDINIAQHMGQKVIGFLPLIRQCNITHGRCGLAGGGFGNLLAKILELVYNIITIKGKYVYWANISAAKCAERTKRING